MNIMDGFRWLAGREAPLQTRAGDSVEDLVQRTVALRTSPWRSASSREAMGVPAVFRARSLIANTVGVLSMEAYRQGEKLEGLDTPRIVVRPNPLTRPHVFYRDTAFHLTGRGEAWWWTAKRDSDGLALSLIPVDPREIMVEENPHDLLRPIIRWRDVVMPNEDMTQITLLPDPANPLRGIGPLQACGAAVSVAVEAQEFAANYFAGSPSSTLLTAEYEITEGEADLIKERWIAGAGNLPKVVDKNMRVSDIAPEPAKAQLNEARSFQNGEVALMFGIPGTLLEHFSAGSSLTYQNVGQEYDKFIRSCLWPNYLEPIEQAMSDLLPRATVARFSVDGLLRADILTRYQVHAIAIDKGIYTPEYADRIEGILPGDVENRPAPFAAPQAVPERLPVQVRSKGLRELRCKACGRLAGRVGHGSEAEIKCRCGQLVTAA